MNVNMTGRASVVALPLEAPAVGGCGLPRSGLHKNEIFSGPVGSDTIRLGDRLGRDDDTLCVTDAPFVSWQKTLSAVTGNLSPLTDYATLAN
ncbi:hypothetical protein [Tropicimonas sp. IMCC6043]|uniref:hypothetical protein n=1 Tax=Tropicimonas sp. IMCC6043 TaxID=2510645 RepID=UPI00101BBF7C|nr:hypothetical protein [Tropicimonas sp. IMCC6043]RYH08420.1 hypothetical protein EU800_16460 [Tropicimonas sp. IMCC6043]